MTWRSHFHVSKSYLETPSPKLIRLFLSTGSESVGDFLESGIRRRWYYNTKLEPVPDRTVIVCREICESKPESLDSECMEVGIVLLGGGTFMVHNKRASFIRVSILKSCIARSVGIVLNAVNI